MLRPALLLLALLLLVPSAAGAATTTSTGVRIVACEPALEQPARALAVEGRMRTVEGARRLQMRFELQVSTEERPKWVRLAAPGFGTYNTADPAPRRYVFEKRVEGLVAPGRYRMVVRFRWLDEDGKRLAGARRTSSACSQPDLRPDLVPERVTVGTHEDPELRRYVVPIANDGRSAALPFAVGASVNGTALPPVSVVTGLQPGGRSELAFVGPRCRPGTTIVVRVDPDGAVDERDEEDNVLSRACPA